MLGGHVRLRQTDRAFPFAEVAFLTVTACSTCEYTPASAPCFAADKGEARRTYTEIRGRT